MECQILLKTQFNFNRMSVASVVVIFMCVCVFCVRCMHDGAFEHVFSIDQQSLFNSIEMYPITFIHKNVMPFKIAQSKKKNKYKLHAVACDALIWKAAGIIWASSLVMQIFKCSPKLPGQFVWVPMTKSLFNEFSNFHDTYSKSKLNHSRSYQSTAYFILFDVKNFPSGWMKKSQAINKFDGKLNIEGIKTVGCQSDDETWRMRREWVK